MSVQDVVSAAQAAGFSGPALTEAVAIALAESGGNPNAVNYNTNGTVDRGLWQINSVHTQYDPAQLFDPVYNAKAAYQISNGGRDWTPWATYPAKAQAELPTAEAATGIAIPTGFDWHSLIPNPLGPIAPPSIPGIPSIPNPLSGLSGITQFFQNLIDPKFWGRILEGAAGVALILIALSLIFRRDITASVRAAAAGASHA